MGDLGARAGFVIDRVFHCATRRPVLRKPPLGNFHLRAGIDVRLGPVNPLDVASVDQPRLRELAGVVGHESIVGAAIVTQCHAHKLAHASCPNYRAAQCRWRMVRLSPRETLDTRARTGLASIFIWRTKTRSAVEERLRRGEALPRVEMHRLEQHRPIIDGEFLITCHREQVFAKRYIGIDLAEILTRTFVDREIKRCWQELVAIEAELLAGNTDLHGLLLALSDWSAELRILQNKQRRRVESRRPSGSTGAGASQSLRMRATTQARRLSSRQTSLRAPRPGKPPAHPPPVRKPSRHCVDLGHGSLAFDAPSEVALSTLPVSALTRHNFP